MSFILKIEEILKYPNKLIFQASMSNMKSTRRITESIKKTVAGKQNYRCAATVADYKCPLYRQGGDGAFDEAGYEIDHIEEFSKNGNDEMSNLQALCPMCHRVKTKRFNQNNKKKRNPPKKYDIGINVFNQQDIIMTKSIKIKNYEDTFVDKEKNVYQTLPQQLYRHKISTYSLIQPCPTLYRKIGTHDKSFKHILEMIPLGIIPKPHPILFPGDLCHQSSIIRADRWTKDYGFTYDDYVKYFNISQKMIFR